MLRILMPHYLYFHILWNAARYDLKPELVMAVIWTESSFRPEAVGNAGMSFGLMQLHLKGAGHGHQPEELLDPATNIYLGCMYLRQCLDATDGSVPDALSAYNQGIAGWQSRGRSINQAYVDRILDRECRLRSAHIELTTDTLEKCKVHIEED